MLDTAAVTGAASAEIGRQSAEIVDTPAAVVITIAKKIVRHGLEKTADVRAEVSVVTI